MVVRVSYRQFGPSTRLFRSTSAEGTPSLQRPTKQRSKYAEWYSDMLPPMIPIALLAATVYGVRKNKTSLRLFKTKNEQTPVLGLSVFRVIPSLAPSLPFWLVQSGHLASGSGWWPSLYL